MEKQVLAVLEPTVEYANLLLGYLQEQKEFMFQVCVFTKEDALRKYVKTTKVHVLLAAEESEYENFRREVDCLILLSSGRFVKGQDKDPVIYKFQSAQRILKEVCSICLEQGQAQEGCYFSNAEETKEQIVVFSPYGGVGKTLTSVVLGHMLGEAKKVLVVNLEPFIKKYRWLQTESTTGVSELIYYVKQENSNLEMKLQTLVTKAGNMDYLQGVSNYLDLQNMTRKDMFQFLQGIRKHTRYDVVIFDVSFFNEATKVLFELCHVILEPVQGESQFEQWKQSFSLEEQRWLERKRKSVPVSVYRELWDEDLEYLGKSQIGQSIWNAYLQEGEVNGTNCGKDTETGGRRSGYGEVYQ